jgi:Mrp family chromosome partitioning ATPase
MKEAIEHVKEMNDAAAALSNEKMGDLVKAFDQASMTDYEEEAGSTFPVWNIPEWQETVFLGRDDTLSQLDTYLEPDPLQSDLKKAVVAGMGGIGKSTVAAQYARLSREKGRYDAIFWIEAEKLSTMRKSFTTVASELEHPKRSDDDENNKMLVMKWLFKTSQLE